MCHLNDHLFRIISSFYNYQQTNPDEYPFGTEGGENYLKYFLKIKPNQKEELRSVRQFIQSSFEELGCSLLPHPGPFSELTINFVGLKLARVGQ
jgi:hypothetical protein